MILGDNKRKTYSRDWPRRFYDISTERKPLVDNRLKAKLPNINHTYSSFSKITRLVFENRTSRTVLFRGRHGTGSEIVSPGSGPRFLRRPSPNSRSRTFQIWFPVPVPDPANFEFESRSQSRILKWVPVPVPDFRDRDCGIPGTLSRMPTPGTGQIKNCGYRWVPAR